MATLPVYDSEIMWWLVAVMCVVVVFFWLFVYTCINMRAWFYRYRHRAIYKRKRVVYRGSSRANGPVNGDIETASVPQLERHFRSHAGGRGVSRAEYFRRS